MGRCTYRTLGRRYGCEKDLAAEVDALSQFVGGFGGDTYFVDPNGGSDAYGGLNPSTPLRTIGAALGKCRAYRNDAIIVAPNSQWLYSDTSVGRANPVSENVIITVPGIRIVGVTPDSPLGVPWIPSADNQTLVTVRAMDVTIEGFNFWEDTTTGGTAISAMWDSTSGYYGENLVVQNCYLYGLAYGIKFDYTWNCVVRNCRFQSISTGAIFNPSVYGEPDYLQVLDCQFVECGVDINLPDCDLCTIEGCTFLDAGAAIAITSGDHNVIIGNSVQADPTGTNNMINLTGGADNLVSDNYLSCTIAQYDTTCSDATSGSWGGNHCANGDTTAAPV